MLFDDDEPEESYEDVTGDESAEGEWQEPRAQEILIGHEDVERRLLDLFQGDRKPHSLIFAGPQGIGKSTMAFRLARFLLKQGGEDQGPSLFGDASEPATSLNISANDPVFQQVASGGHPDILTIERPFDEKKGQRKNELAVDEIRKIPVFMHKTSAMDNGWRIVIVDDADMMNRNSQNALLKILEEPPKKSLLILIAHRLGVMLPTILSRSAVIHFQPLPESQISDFLKQFYPHDVDELKLVASLANGSLGRAITYGDNENFKIIRNTIDILATWPRFDWSRIQLFAESFTGKGVSEEGLATFQAFVENISEQAAKYKATERSDFPVKELRPLVAELSLARILEICERLKQNFTDVKIGNLDKRQIAMGAFMAFEQ